MKRDATLLSKFYELSTERFSSCIEVDLGNAKWVIAPLLLNDEIANSIKKLRARASGV
jgi:hypothetical protein